jgi:electron transport complex protein RnfB
MELNVIVGPLLPLLGLGVIFGAGLAIASAKLKVASDPRLDEIADLLPSANCGACGYAGCQAMAEALLAGKANSSACTLIPRDVAERAAEIAGTSVGETKKRVAVVFCRAEGVGERFEYWGVADCAAAALAQGGPSACPYACLGLGTCASVCPFDAITMGADGLPHVDAEKCVACGKCVAACPRGIIALVPMDHHVHVLCSSHDKGALVRKLCKAGCIACKLCEKACKFDAIKVVDNVARIDYEKCTLCGACIEACPRGIIRDIRKDENWPEAGAAIAAEKANA